MIKVIDPVSNQPVANATVNMNLSYPGSFSFAYSGRTNSSGEVTLVSRNAIQEGLYVSRITNISKSGVIYEPSLVTKTLEVN